VIPLWSSISPLAATTEEEDDHHREPEKSHRTLALK
jgi:hypothetical protein